MATYIQGVQDYIPQIQPFQPNLNLYANVLQTKQTQYDKNHKALSNIYGQYFYADLTREGNIERKDELLKNIEHNLQKVASMDLSLEQNVNAAKQLFRPFYEDQYMMKDMAWTKTYMNQKGAAEGLKNSENAELRARYWDAGVRELDYRREEFKEVSDDESLSFGNVSYTPYVNVIEKAQKLAKDAGLSVESVEFSPDGRWIVKSKNGQQLMEPLSKLFEASLGSDPSVQSVYKTQAYVNRKDYAYGNASMFGGDVNKAEAKYLENAYNMLKQENIARYNMIKETSNVYQKNIDDIEKQIASGKHHPQAQMMLQQYKSNKEINDAILARIENESKEFGSNQTATTQGNTNPYGDIKTLRAKVDAAMASKYMQKDLNEAAQIFAYKDAKVDYEANPYAVNEQKHQHAMAQIGARNQGLKEVALLKASLEKNNINHKAKLDSGAYMLGEDGELIKNPLFDVHTEPTAAGTATDKLNMIQEGRRLSRETQMASVDPAISTMLNQMQSLISSGKMTKEQAKQILAGRDYDKFVEGFNSDSYKYISGNIKVDNLEKIVNNYKNFLDQRKADHSFGGPLAEFAQASTQVGDYIGYYKEYEKWKKNESKAVTTELKKQGFKHTELLYDEKGNLRSKEAFYEAMIASNPSMSKEYNLYKKVQQREKEERALKTNAKVLLGMTGLPEGVSDFLAGAYKEIHRGIGPASWFERWYEKNQLEPISYEKMIKEANNVWANPNVVKSPPPAISKGSGTAMYSQSSSVMVSAKAPGTPGYAFALQTFQDTQKLDFTDVTSNYFSFQGPTQIGAGTIEDRRARTEKGLAILNKLKSSSHKLDNFMLKAHPIAVNNQNMGAMTIMLPAKFIDENTSTSKVTKLFSETEANFLKANGLTIISKRENWTNGLYRGSGVTPLEALVNSAGEFVYSDPVNPNNKLRIQPSKSGVSDYLITSEFDYGNGQIQTVPIYHDRFSGTLEDIRKEYQQDVLLLNKHLGLIP